MVCPRCGFENKKRSRYCRMCGVTFTRKMRVQSKKNGPLLMLPEKTESHPENRPQPARGRTAGGARPQPPARPASPARTGDTARQAPPPRAQEPVRGTAPYRTATAVREAPPAREPAPLTIARIPNVMADEPKVLPLYDEGALHTTKYELNMEQPKAIPLYDNRLVPPTRTSPPDPEFSSVFQSHDDKEYDDPKPSDIQWFIFAVMFFVLALLVTLGYVKFIGTMAALLVIMGGIGGLVSLIILIMKAVHKERKLTPAVWLVVYTLIIAFGLVREFFL